MALYANDAAAAASYSSSSSSSSTRRYDVFLNFRGTDTRKKFIGHLYKALDNKGVHTFFDNEEIPTGKEITSTLLTAIEQSRISIPVFSKDYANSKYCLQELAKIHQCSGQVVLPIFFDVEPSDVRHQTGSFVEAFKKHKMDLEQDIVDKWREALTEVGKLKGWALKEVENGDESKLVQLVVGRVLRELNNTHLVVAKHPIGLNSHVEYLLSLSCVESTDPLFVGICGLGGIGKTTMAKAVYNRIFKRFDGSCFLKDVREHDLVHLQVQLLNDILGKQNLDISHVARGSKIIEERLQQQKVLLILDDVDDHTQLNALAGELNWFGPGSRVIITARDEHVLKLGQVHYNNIYKPKGLDDKQSLQLFSMHAFQRDQPPEDYMQLSREVVSYAEGLPLTLEVLGGLLYDVGGKKKWESALQKLKEVPPKEVQSKLKISYDGLDANEKAIFLDIACFFIGMNKQIVLYIWEGCGYYPDIELNVLIQKSLVRIDENNELKMHAQLRDMGRRIVHEECPKEPGEHSRLWSREEVMEVLEEHKGTKKIEGIILDSMWGSILPDPRRRDRLRIEDFTMMSNLRLLQVNGVDLKGNIAHLPSKLIWFSWQNCHLEFLPSDFYLKKLIVLDLSNSNIRQAWNRGLQNKRFENLKVLNLSRCLYLANSPDFTGFPQLERLIFKQCWALVNVHESIGNLKGLVHLDLTECINLQKLPRNTSTLLSLKELVLSSCELLENFAMRVESAAFRPTKLGQHEPIMDIIWKIRSLVWLDLAGTLIEFIPSTVRLFEKLEILRLNNCRSLMFISELPSCLIHLDASGCVLLEELPDLSNLKNLRTLCLVDCKKLAKIQGLEGLESLEYMDVTGCITLANTPTKDLVQESNRAYSFCRSYQIGDDEINKGMMLCLVFKLEEEIQMMEQDDELVNGILNVKACIHRSGKRINYLSDLRIKGIQMIHPEITYIHHFQGLNWFAFPLKGKDEIEIEEIEWCGVFPRSELKHFELLLDDDIEHVKQPMDVSPPVTTYSIDDDDFFNKTEDFIEELRKEEEALEANRRERANRRHRRMEECKRSYPGLL